ncbi:hypothetical protein [uncultured Nostoc sp.]|uniref:hypothetical protein n=1 Tax=uncultured Nostoc sp. TaxID=340711 RepID=UPI00262A521E|nr:hypothetical protein [uncultured Nostoc sp.]
MVSYSLKPLLDKEYERLLLIYVFYTLLILFSTILGIDQSIWAETQEICESDRQPAEC